MRRSYNRKGFSKANPYREMKWYAPTYNNANYGPDKVCLVRRPGSAGSGDLAIPLRFLNISPETVGTEEVDRSIILKKIDIDFPVLPVIGMARVNGTLLEYTQGVRDDVPVNTGIADVSGYTGHLVGGTFDTSTLVGAQSHQEGLVLNWMLTYDTNAEWAEAESSLEPFDNSFYRKNRRIFDQGHTVATIYRPGRIRIEKTFTGKGVMLTPGARETYAMSLWIWMPQNGGGTITADGLSVVTTKARFGYFDND